MCWFTFPFIRPSFLLCYYISPGCMSTSCVRVWGWVSDRVTTDPLFVRMSHALLRLFSDGREVLGSRVSLLGVDCVRHLPSGCCHCVVWVVFTFLPFWVVCSFVHCEGPSPCVWFVGGICFSPLPFLLSYFLVNISLMFMFRWKAIVGGLENSCCRWLFYAVPSFCKGFPQAFEVRVVLGNVHQGDFVVLWSVSQETFSVV